MSSEPVHVSAPPGGYERPALERQSRVNVIDQTEDQEPSLKVSQPLNETKDKVEILKRVAFLNKHMPPEDLCMFRLTTTKGLIWKRWSAVKEIVPHGRLVFDQDTISLIPQQDCETQTVVSFELHRIELEKAGAYFLNPTSFFVPFDVEAFNKALLTVRADHVMGFCITKKSCEIYTPTLDLYVMKSEEHAYCYITKVRMLVEEYAHFGETDFMKESSLVTSQIRLEAHEFKSLLSASQQQRGQI
jgi:hypothetical protein